MGVQGRETPALSTPDHRLRHLDTLLIRERDG